MWEENIFKNYLTKDSYIEYVTKGKTKGDPGRNEKTDEGPSAGILAHQWAPETVLSHQLPEVLGSNHASPGIIETEFIVYIHTCRNVKWYSYSWSISYRSKHADTIGPQCLSQRNGLIFLQKSQTSVQRRAVGNSQGNKLWIDVLVWKKGKQTAVSFILWNIPW